MEEDIMLATLFLVAGGLCVIISWFKYEFRFGVHKKSLKVSWDFAIRDPFYVAGCVFLGVGAAILTFGG